MRGFVVGWMDREKDGRGQRAEGRGQRAEGRENGEKTERERGVFDASMSEGA
jgi:hypothetical protein